jgi:two-component system NtrC family response regulator
VNAASLSDELFNSQLFGHVRGAFSGAVSDAVGLVTKAEGGTLFLDEVADLSPAGQAKLLRFLQDGEYSRVGSTDLRRANVRVLSAANVRLADRVAAGRFREDLLYRLVILPIEVPPLRERGDDVLLLARHFLKAAAEKDRVPAPRLSADVASALRAYAWPGNVRELENEMRRLVVLARGRVLRREDLSTALKGGASCAAVRGLLDGRLAYERDHVRQALVRNQGHRTRAAAELGITRQALYEKIRRLGLKDPSERS